MAHNIGFLVFPDFQILDLAGPLTAFEAPTRTVAPKPYRFHVLSERGGSIKSSSGLEVMTRPLSKMCPLETHFLSVAMCPMSETRS
jgi:transcriptional regulator GlxA family with amidase domain